MINLFNNLNSRNKGILYFPEFDFIKRGILPNLKTVNNYYRSGAYATGSNHELVKLLYGLSVSYQKNLFEYYRIVDAKALTVAQQLGFTTQISKGKIFNNIFFSGHSQEIIIVTDEIFDYVKANENWKDLRPVRVLKHNKTDINCFLFDGKIPSNSINVFSINLPMLAIQYRAYRQWQFSYDPEGAARNSIYHFLYSYPLLNMIYDGLDYAIFNRLLRKSLNKPINDYRFKHPFHITDFSHRLDRILDMMIDVIKKNNLDISTLLQTVKLVNNNSAFELLRLPDVFETRQINWAIYLSRIDALVYILSYMDKTNINEKNKVIYQLRKYLNDNSIRSALPVKEYTEQKYLIESIINT